MRKTLFVLAATGIAAGSAQAQSYSSFLQLDSSSGINLQLVSEDTYTVSLDAAPTITYLGVTYSVTDVFGFWALSTSVSNFADTSSFGVWSANENIGGGGGSISGWRTNPNTGIVASGSELFKFDSLNEGLVQTFGYHIRVSGQLPTGGNTAHFILPAPGALTLAGIGGLIAARRRR